MLGGLITLAATIGIMSFFLVLVRQILRKEKSQIVNSFQKRGDTSFGNDTLINLTRNNFDIALSINYIGSQIGVAENLDEYFSFYIQQVYTEIITDKQKQKELGSTYTWVTTPMKLVKCNIDRFSGLREEIEAFGINKNYYCPQNDFLIKLQGSFSTSQAKLMEIKVDYCN